MNSTPPLVTVIIAAHNGAHTIGEQLEALADQRDAPRFEVLVVDNNSTDDLASVVAELSARLDVRIVPASELQGQAYARNIGAEAARGTFILFCDQDDMVSPQWVESLSSLLREPGTFATGPLELRRYNSDEVRILFAGSDADEVTPYTIGGYLPFAYGCNLGFRRSDFLELGGFDNSFQGGGEDQDLSWRAIENGLRLSVSPQAKVSYRLRDEARGLLRQQRGYGRSGSLLRTRFADRGLPGPSVRWVVARMPETLVTLACLQVSPDRVSLRDAKRAGTVLGSAEALVRYRLLRQIPPRQLIRA